MAIPVDERYCYLIEPFGTTSGRQFPHTGDDWARKKVGGNPIQEQPDIYAVYSGTVIAAGWDREAGNRTVIHYWFGRFGVYGHQAKILVTVGQAVTEGERIGLLGGTGIASGPHLHYSQYTDQARALSGIVRYWQGVKWASVDQWAAASGLIRPDYTSKSSNERAGFLMALSDAQQQELLKNTRDIAKALRVPDAPYDWLPAINNKIDTLLKDTAASKSLSQEARDALLNPVGGFAPIDVIRTHAVATLKAVREQAASQGVHLDEQKLADGVLDALGAAIVNRD
jgi:murein DD-endopeptidase MepM/ murein hydrolase activator NlpD